MSRPWNRFLCQGGDALTGLAGDQEEDAGAEGVWGAGEVGGDPPLPSKGAGLLLPHLHETLQPYVGQTQTLSRTGEDS